MNRVSRVSGIFLLSILSGCAVDKYGCFAATDKAKEDSLEKSLEITSTCGPSLMRSMQPILMSSFQALMAETGKANSMGKASLAMEKASLATEIWFDPRSQAKILAEQPDIQSTLLHIGLSASDFSKALQLLELGILRKKGISETAQEVKVDLDKCDQFVSDFGAGKISGPALAQWQMLPMIKAQTVNQVKALEMTAREYSTVQKYLHDAEIFLTGDAARDWISPKTVDK
jgi:hypothetical protein